MIFKGRVLQLILDGDSSTFMGIESSSLSLLSMYTCILIRELEEVFYSMYSGSLSY